MMEIQDFEMPSPKRQRTNSPEVMKKNESNMADTSSFSTAQATNSQTTDNDMLDLLMQHVEAEAGPLASTRVQQIQHDAVLTSTAVSKPVEDDMVIDTAEKLNSNAAPNATRDENLIQAESETKEPRTASQLPPGLETSEPTVIAHVKAVADAEQLPATAETLLQEQLPDATTDLPVQDEQQQEWEIDSSPYDSSSDDSSDTSSDSESESGDDYPLLDPREQARILMAEDGGGGADSDEEGGARTARGGGQNLRTHNEQAEAVPPKPDIIVTEHMQIEELGHIEAIVENNVLIKAKISGSYQVLESGSVLCLVDRQIIGVVAETLGRVEEPLYTVRFVDEQDIVDSGVSAKGTTVYYVKDHSTFVFTQPLKAVKGSDASNLHDEEVGEDEMEFSDDEAEAEYKRMVKAKRKGIDPAAISDRGRGGRGRGRGHRGNYQHHNSHSEAYNNDSMEMNYDDVEASGTDYTPLRRPDPSAFNHGQQSSSRGSQNHRGGRGRGSRPRGRGNNSQNSRMENPSTTNSMYGQSQGQYYPGHQQVQPSYFGFQMPPPPPPQLTPGGGYPGNSIPPSPMTPLPGAAGNFDFVAAAQNQWQQYHHNQNNQFQQQFTGQINAEAIAQVQRQLQQMQQQNGQGGQPRQQ